jgi:hypothetical protein
LFRYWTLVLYGTVISTQKNDDLPPQQQTNNSQVLNSSSSNGTSSNRVKSPGGGKKTTQKATTLSPQGTTAANGRKNGGGKQKSGKNGNGKNSQRPLSTTTPRPSSSFATATSQNSIKNKTGKTSTTPVRPRPTAKLPNSKNNNNNNELSPSKGLDKYQPSYSNIYEKSSGKGPKQVKEGSYTTAPRLEATQNPSMSKMFERYEKIQEIFPELEPYKEANNPVFFTVSNGKPSRENSKPFSSFVSSFDSVPQKKNTPTNEVKEARQRVASSADGSGKGTEQFSLMAPIHFSRLLVFLLPHTQLVSMFELYLLLFCLYQFLLLL